MFRITYFPGACAACADTSKPSRISPCANARSKATNSTKLSEPPKNEAGRDARHVKVEVTLHGEGKAQTATLTYQLDRRKLRVARRREGRYLLRANMTVIDPVKMWEYYLQLTEIEQAFKELKGDLAVRPIHHQLQLKLPEQAPPIIQAPPPPSN